MKLEAISIDSIVKPASQHQCIDRGVVGGCYLKFIKKILPSS